ncbi:Importin subunit alpha-3 [Hypsibius exemplaris]|uniref:Importin subunit alpha n=1 Tax=Hypsibius exemplaris TaxID=2072580 RepID=A0A1W0WS12_HYPEX|nr:Importin subunit alpha-3 [Hypsibius exemplaris]
MNGSNPFLTPPSTAACKAKYRSQETSRKSQTPEDARKRSERREEFLAKRRSGSFETPNQQENIIRKESVSSYLAAFAEFQHESSSAPANSHALLKGVLGKMKSTEPKEVFKAVQKVRLVTALEENPPLELLVRMGFVRPLVSLLTPETEKHTLFEATWALCNIAGGASSNTLAVVAEGALAPLIGLFGAADPELVGQAIWAVGNIVSDNGHFRNMALDNGLLDSIFPFLKEDTSLALARSVSWLIVNICRTRNPPPSVDVIEALLPKIVWMVRHGDQLVRVDAVWSMAYLSDEPPELADLLVRDTVVLQSIADIPDSNPDNVKFLMGAVRLLGNLLSGTDAHCDAVIRADFVRRFPALLQSNFKCVQRETLMCVANVAAGSAEQIQTIIDVPDFLIQILAFLQNDNRALVQEALWVVSNVVQGGNLWQITALLDCGVVLPLCDHLSSRDVNLVKIVLETVSDLLKRCPSDFMEQVCATIEKCGGFAKIELLQQHDNEILCDLAYFIVDTFFKEDEYDQDDFFSWDPAATAAGVDTRSPYFKSTQ